MGFCLRISWKHRLLLVSLFSVLLNKDAHKTVLYLTLYIYREHNILLLYALDLVANMDWIYYPVKCKRILHVLGPRLLVLSHRFNEGCHWMWWIPTTPPCQGNLSISKSSKKGGTTLDLLYGYSWTMCYEHLQLIGIMWDKFH